MEFRFLPFLTRSRSRGISPHIGMEIYSERRRLCARLPNMYYALVLMNTCCTHNVHIGTDNITITVTEQLCFFFFFFAFSVFFFFFFYFYLFFIFLLDDTTVQCRPSLP
jgi:hypothetical protein